MNETLTAPSEAPLIIQFIPLIIFSFLFAILIVSIAIRKGKNVVISFICAMIPFVSFIYAIWLASQTDAKLLQRIEDLENKNG